MNRVTHEVGIATFDVATISHDNDAPVWIKLAPRGRFTARDGRVFDVSPEALVERFTADKIDIAIDLDHATVKKAPFGETAPAVGWIDRLEARGDGLYGRADFLASGREVLRSRTHRYVSPSLQLEKETGRALWLHSVALIAAPAASMPAVASASFSSSTEHPGALPETLGATSMKVITPAVLDATFRGFKTSFQIAFDGAASEKSTVAMEVQSQTAEEAYGWLGSFPNMREWIGERHVHGLQSHGYAIRNKKWESTVAVSRDDIADDKVGLYAPRIKEMGRVARQHPDSLIFALLKAGFATNCYDGQFFFDTDHPVIDISTGLPTSVSNVQAGAGAPWFLIDASRAVKPIIWQEREDYEFQFLDDHRSERVFMRDEYLYGIRSRANCGFGLWQLAFASKAALTAENYAAARAAMMEFKGDNGLTLGVVPTHLVVPPTLETAARTVLFSDTIEGTSNIWKGTAQLIMTPFIS